MKNKAFHIHPATFYLLLLIGVVFLSWMGNVYGWKVVHPASQEVIVVRNLLSAEYLRGMLLHVFENFSSFSPLGSVVVCMLGVGVADHSGFLPTALQRLFKNKRPQRTIVFLVIVLGILSNVLSDTGYILLLPLAALLFRGIGLHPLAGVITAYVSVACGFSANLFLSTLDPLLSSITQDALSRLPDATITVGPLSNYYFMFVSSGVIAIIIYLITMRWLLPYLQEKLPLKQTEFREKSLSHKEKRALTMASFVGVAYMILVLYFTFSPLAILAGTAGVLSHSPFATGAIFWLSLGVGLMGIVYGWASGRYLSDIDVVKGMAHYKDLLITFLIIVFFASLMIDAYRESHLDRFFALVIAQNTPLFPYCYEASLFSFIVMVALSNLFVLSATGKWKLFAYLFLPFFLEIGGAPSEIQCAFRIGDSITNVSTPFLIYVPLLLAYLQQFSPKLGWVALWKLTWRFACCIGLAWMIIYFIWITLNIPLGN